MGGDMSSKYEKIESEMEESNSISNDSLQETSKFIWKTAWNHSTFNNYKKELKNIFILRIILLFLAMGKSL